MFLVKPGTKPEVERVLSSLGGKIIPFAVSRSGLEVRSDPAQPGWENLRDER